MLKASTILFKVLCGFFLHLEKMLRFPIYFNFSRLHWTDARAYVNRQPVFLFVHSVQWIKTASKVQLEHTKKNRAAIIKRMNKEAHANETWFDDGPEYFIRKLHSNSGNTLIELRNAKVQYWERKNWSPLFPSMKLNYLRISNSFKELYWI